MKTKMNEFTLDKIEELKEDYQYHKKRLKRCYKELKYVYDIDMEDEDEKDEY